MQFLKKTLFSEEQFLVKTFFGNIFIAYSSLKLENKINVYSVHSIHTAVCCHKNNISVWNAIPNITQM